MNCAMSEQESDLIGQGKIKKDQKQSNFLKPASKDPLKAREEFAISLRKQKKQQIINKKRRKIQQAAIEDYPGVYLGYMPWRNDKYEEQTQIVKKFVDFELDEDKQIGVICDILRNSERTQIQRLGLLTKIRQILAKEDTNSKPGAIQTFEPKLIELINQQLKTECQSEIDESIILETLWILTNLSFYCDTNQILSPDFEIKESLIKIMSGTNLQMIDQTYFFVGNWLTEKDTFRNKIDIIQMIGWHVGLPIMKNHQLVRNILNVIRLLTSKTELKELGDPETGIFGNAILKFIENYGHFDHDTEGILLCVIEIILNLSKIDRKSIFQIICNQAVAAFLTGCLEWNSILNETISNSDRKEATICNILEIIGRCSCQEIPEFIKTFIDHKLIIHLARYIQSDVHRISKSACWIYSNLVTSTDKAAAKFQIQEFLLTGPVVKITQLASDSCDIDIQKESLWVVCNILNEAENYTVKEMWDLCQALDIPNIQDQEIIDEMTGEKEINYATKALLRGIKTMHDESLVHNILQALKRLIDVDEIYELSEMDKQVNVFVQIDEYGGEKALNACIERFTAHTLTGQDQLESQSVYVIASKILEVIQKHREPEEMEQLETNGTKFQI